MRVKKISEMKLSKIIILSALCMLAASCGPKLEKGLVLYSPFEEDASDYGPFDLDGELLNKASIADDSAVGESSVYLDGDMAYVEYPSGKAYFNTDYTVSVWVKWEEPRVFARIFDFNQIMPGEGNAIALYSGSLVNGIKNDMWFEQWAVTEDGAVRNIIDVDKVPAEASLGYDYKTGQWDHYVIVYKASALNLRGTKKGLKGQKVPYKGKVTLYVNGKKVGQTTRCMKPQALPTVANWLGRSRYSGDPRFKGWMDDFRIYSRCLSGKEIDALYKLGSE